MHTLQYMMLLTLVQYGFVVVVDVKHLQLCLYRFQIYFGHGIVLIVCYLNPVKYLEEQN